MNLQDASKETAHCAKCQHECLLFRRPIMMHVLRVTLQEVLKRNIRDLRLNSDHSFSTKVYIIF